MWKIHSFRKVGKWGTFWKVHNWTNDVKAPRKDCGREEIFETLDDRVLNTVNQQITGTNPVKKINFSLWKTGRYRNQCHQLDGNRSGKHKATAEKTQITKPTQSPSSKNSRTRHQNSWSLLRDVWEDNSLHSEVLFCSQCCKYTASLEYKVENAEPVSVPEENRRGTPGFNSRFSKDAASSGRQIGDRQTANIFTDPRKCLSVTSGDILG